jgi:glucosylceramidase
VTVDPATTYQNIDGFGFCLTEGSAEVITSLNSTQQASLLSELFDTTNGLGISVLRIGIGATDLSSSDYSYDDVSGNASLTSFSLSGPDLTYLLPVLKKILAINPTIKILATPWSAPKWMKTNTSWVGGDLQASFYSTYANYFIKYFDAMKAQGINIWAITPQNEPENAGNEPSMLMNSTDETNFINLYLGPAMASNGYSGIKIIAYDHNCNDTTYPIDVCNNSTYVDGAAFHLYAGDISALTTVKNATGKNVYFTEQYTAGTGSFSGDFPWHIQNVVIGSLNNSAKAVLEWNLASNSSFGPRTSGGCSSCQGAITITGSATFTRNVSYYIIGQISKFVKAGAVRIKASTTTAGYLSCGFKNPDGTLAVMAFNNKSTSQVYKFLVGIQAFTYTIPANSAATFTWNPNFSAIPETQINKLIISPNPVRNFIDLKSFDAEVNINSVEIISMNGEVMFNQSLPSGFQTKRIDISDLSSGIYTIRLKGNVGYTYSRFIKE